MLNKNVERIVELYFQGKTVYDAIGIVKMGSKDKTNLERDLKELEKI